MVFLSSAHRQQGETTGDFSIQFSNPLKINKKQQIRLNEVYLFHDWVNLSDRNNKIQVVENNTTTATITIQSDLILTMNDFIYRLTNRLNDNNNNFQNVYEVIVDTEGYMTIRTVAQTPTDVNLPFSIDWTNATHSTLPKKYLGQANYIDKVDSSLNATTTRQSIESPQIASLLDTFHVFPTIDEFNKAVMSSMKTQPLGTFPVAVNVPKHNLINLKNDNNAFALTVDEQMTEQETSKIFPSLNIRLLNDMGEVINPRTDWSMSILIN